MSGMVEQIFVLAWIGLEVEQLALIRLTIRIERQAPPVGDHGMVVDATVDARMELQESVAPFQIAAVQHRHQASARLCSPLRHRHWQAAAVSA